MTTQPIPIRPEGVRALKATVVIATLALVGRGTPDDPAREVIELWLPSGEPLATLDPQEATFPPLSGSAVLRAQMGRS